jgi:hypothetical protein
MSTENPVSKLPEIGFMDMTNHLRLLRSERVVALPRDLQEDEVLEQGQHSQGHYYPPPPGLVERHDKRAESDQPEQHAKNEPIGEACQSPPVLAEVERGHERSLRPRLA